ncbi:MAG TPA: L-threonylcarbamoyladenylate synthase, partial [Patescibacteria group bacterium]|nr:L-threonylcarbamoyladenylate synthase [Patescibacteria group bacterium]
MSIAIFTSKEQSILQCAQALQKGQLVVFPTETVYGLGADATNTVAIQQIFNVKGRPSDNPLIVHIASMEQLPQVAQSVPEHAKKLAQAFWPGPLTLVLPKTHTISTAASADLETVAVRIPNHPIALQLLRLANIPVAAPSANKSGRPSPTTVAHVLQDFINEPLIFGILDGGPCSIGIESTVVDVTGVIPYILRPGIISKEQLESVLQTN